MAAYKPTRVYCANTSDTLILKDGIISHPVRAAEISAARNASVRAQKLFSWKLLEYAYSDYFGKSMCDADFVKDSNGKWQSSDSSFFFSLSHTDRFCAVAIGFVPCGVDIEGFNRERFTEALARKILCVSEYAEYEELDPDEKREFCAKKWTQKESAFKMIGREVFVPHDLCYKDFSLVTQTVVSGDKRFFLTLCAEDAEEAEFMII